MLNKEKQEIVLNNLSIVYAVAKRLNQKNFEDIIQEGIYALCLAADTFDEKLGKFSTYAYTKVYYHMLSRLDKEVKYKNRFDNDLELLDNIELENLSIDDEIIDAKNYYNNLIGRLSDMNKMIVYMYYCGFTQDEIAKKVERSRGTIAERLKTIRNKEKENYERRIKRS